MERERLSIKITAKRLQKLRDVAESQEKSMTRMVEDWIDRLPNPEKIASEVEVAE